MEPQCLINVILSRPTGYVTHHQINTLRTGEADLRF